MFIWIFDNGYLGAIRLKTVGEICRERLQNHSFLTKFIYFKLEINIA